MTDDRPIFVFGSNTKGRHGKGSALYAKEERGAIYGQAEGLQGNSYGIPTRDGSERRITTLPIATIEWHVIRFLAFAMHNPQLKFEVTKIGCLNAGFTEQDIAPLFAGAPDNCLLPEGWREIIAQQA